MSNIEGRKQLRDEIQSLKKKKRKRIAENNLNRPITGLSPFVQFYFITLRMRLFPRKPGM